MTQHEGIIDTIINGIALLIAIPVAIVIAILVLLGYAIMSIGLWILGKVWSLIE